MAGVLTRKQIEDEALDNIAKSGVLTLQSGTTLGTRMTTFVNRAQMWLARRADLLQNIANSTTVLGQSSYAFPQNTRTIYTLRLIDGLLSRKLECVMPWEMDKKVPNSAVLTQSRSWFYIPYTQTMTFELFPIPQDAYQLTLRYSYYPSDFSTATSVSQYTNCDDALVAYATMYGFLWLQELKDAKYWEGFGDEIVQKIQDTYDEATLFPDWTPAMEGFTVNQLGYSGDYYNNPFVRDANLSTWWR